MKINQIIIVENKLNEFAPAGAGDDREPDEDEILHKLAGRWWLGTEQDMIKVEKTLSAMGWEIGEDEGSYDNGGVFVVRAGDVNGNSYMSWPHEDLELDEGQTSDMRNFFSTQQPLNPAPIQSPTTGPVIASVTRPSESVKENMPSSVLKNKQRNASMTDQEFHKAHKDKSEDELKAMAYRHGYGKDSTHYVEKHKKGQGVAEAFPSGQKDPWEKYEFHHEGKKLGHIYSSNGQAPFKTRRKVGKYIKQMHHATRADAEKHLISKHKETMQDVEEGENWSKHNNKRVGGMSKKSVSSYRRSHPGSKIQTAVTTKPSKLKKGSKSAKRRASFCARMRGMKKHRTGAKTARDPNSNINKSLRRWHCESVEELQQLLMIAEQKINEAKNLKQQAAIAISKKNSIKEGKPEEKEADYGDDYQDMVKRVGQKAKQQELAKKKQEEKPKELDESTEQLNKILTLSGYKK